MRQAEHPRPASDFVVEVIMRPRNRTRQGGQAGPSVGRRPWARSSRTAWLSHIWNSPEECS